jgi:hypothetical protein
MPRNRPHRARAARKIGRFACRSRLGRLARLARLASLVSVASLVTSSSAHAEPSVEDKAVAATLFKDAKALLDAGRVEEACRKLEESERLYAAAGTLLNLAVCHEREGRTASAWEEFREAYAVAVRDQRTDRATFAQEHVRDLEGRLSKLVIVVPKGEDVQGVAITIDGHALGRAAWGDPIPLDPASHEIVATAPGKRRFAVTVVIARDEALRKMTIPPWSDEPRAAEPTPPPPPPPGTSASASASQVSKPVTQVETQAPPAAAPPSRAPIYIAGTVAVMGAAMGGYFGGLAIAEHNKAQDTCTTTRCFDVGQAYNDRSKVFADASTIAFSVSGAALAVGAYLWLTRDHDASEASTPKVSIAPAVGPSGGALEITGRFR